MAMIACCAVLYLRCSLYKKCFAEIPMLGEGILRRSFSGELYGGSSNFTTGIETLAVQLRVLKSCFKIICNSLPAPSADGS